MRTFRWLPVSCMLKDRKTSARLWTGVDERKYPENFYRKKKLRKKIKNKKLTGFLGYF